MTCIAVVDFPVPPFSLPTTMTWAGVGRSLIMLCLGLQPLRIVMQLPRRRIGARLGT